MQSTTHSVRWTTADLAIFEGDRANRLEQLPDQAGHLTAAPKLVVEVLPLGKANEQRDREAKLKLYSVRGVLEYWIVNGQTQSVEVYRRENAVLKPVATLYPQASCMKAALKVQVTATHAGSLMMSGKICLFKYRSNTGHPIPATLDAIPKMVTKIICKNYLTEKPHLRNRKAPPVDAGGAFRLSSKINR